jgi:hypothetical protein
MRPRFALPSLVAFTALLLPVLLGAPSAHALQHVANGGFEQGLTGWTFAPGVAVTVVGGVDEIAPAEGSSSARIELGGAGLALRYRLAGALAAGPYTLSLVARSASAGVTVSIMLQPEDTGQPHFDVASGLASAGWTQFAGGLTLERAAEATVTVRAEGSAGALVYIDDVRLDGAPPVTLTPTAPATSAPSPTAGASKTARPSAGAPSPTFTPTSTPAVVTDAIGSALRNGGFEDLDAAGAPFAWEKYGGVLSNDAQSHSGSRAARLDSVSGSTKWLHQAVIVRPGAWYTFEAWVLHRDAGVASAFLRVSWYASTDASGAAIDAADSTARLTTPAPAYRYLTTDAIAAPPDARSARARILLAPVSGGAASIAVDDAAFYAASAPAIETTPVATTLETEPVADAEASAADGARARQSGVQHSASAPRAFDAVSAGAADIVINEILYDADGDVADANAEWVELYNTSDTPIDIGGWTLRDAASADALPPLVVPARAFAIVAASNAFHDAYPDVAAPVAILGGRIGNALGNGGDRLFLVDAAGMVMDALSWGGDTSVFAPAIGDVPSGHSLERLLAGVDSDRAADFVDNTRPSPGEAYEAIIGKPKPRISGSAGEVLTGSGARDWDWLPWALVAFSAAVCASTVGWRVAVAVRERVLRA